MELTKKELKKVIKERTFDTWAMVAICLMLLFAAMFISSDLVSKKLVQMPDVAVLLMIVTAWVFFCARASIKQIRNLQTTVKYVEDFKTRDYESVEKILPLVKISYDDNNYNMLRAIKQDLAIKITNHTARILIDRAACQCIIDGQVKGPIVAFVHQALGD